MTNYSITNLDGFAETIRDGAAKSISENYTENLDNFITLQQIKHLVVKKSFGVDDDGLYMINEDTFDDLFEEIRFAIYQVGLAKLASQNKIECAWDDQTNQMVFWLNTPQNGEIPINNSPSDSDNDQPIKE